MAKSKEKIIGTPTANGVIKGRPGKGRVLSLEQRKRCYSGHAMTEENTFRYTAKRIKGKPKPVERAWCKKCRATSRKSSATARRLREAKEAKAKGSNAATSAKPKGLTAAKAKGSKAAGARRVKTGKAAKAKGSKAASAKPKSASRKRAA